MTDEQTTVVRGRTGARLAAVQALYQMEVEPTSPEIVINEFVEHRFTDPDRFHILKPDINLFRQIIVGVFNKQLTYDSLIENVLSEGWKLERLETVIRAILRAAVYELVDQPDTPKAVVINEYVNLTKAFYSGQEPSFVNASLDNLAKKMKEC